MPSFSFCVPLEDPSLDGHFPGKPIVPGVVLLAEVSEAIARALPGARIHRFSMVKFVSPLLPGETATIEIAATAPLVQFRCTTRDGRMLAAGSAEIAAASAS